MNEELKQLQEQATLDCEEFLIGDTTTYHRSSAFFGMATAGADPGVVKRVTRLT